MTDTRSPLAPRPFVQPIRESEAVACPRRALEVEVADLLEALCDAENAERLGRLIPDADVTATASDMTPIPTNAMTPRMKTPSALGGTEGGSLRG